MTAAAARLSTGAVVRELFVSSRPVSWINTAYPFAAAYLLTTREIDATLVVGTLFFLIPYNLAMYGINDVFDYESDLRNPRKGGAHGAVLDRRLHRITLWAAGLSCLPFVAFLVLVGPRPPGRCSRRASSSSCSTARRRCGSRRSPSRTR
nr:hypothetical protein GCM10025699_32100 [Microbacterium flavescens]